jgi:hypothetical protein
LRRVAYRISRAVLYTALLIALAAVLTPRVHRVRTASQPEVSLRTPQRHSGNRHSLVPPALTAPRVQIPDLTVLTVSAAAINPLRHRSYRNGLRTRAPPFLPVLSTI